MVTTSQEQASSYKEISNFVSPGTFRHDTFVKPKLQWKKRIDDSILKQPLGWRRFFAQLEGCDDIEKLATQNPVICDSLSFTATIDFVLERVLKNHKSSLSVLKNGVENIQNIVILGSASSECKVLEKTNYFDLLVSRYNVKISFVGPELKGKVESLFKDAKINGGKCEKIQGKPFYKTSLPNGVERFLQYKKLKEGKILNPNNTIFVIFNGGFGNRLNKYNYKYKQPLKQPLFHSWLPDLKYLSQNQYICVFTSASKETDLVGEIIIHSMILKSRFILSPMDNPHHMASHLVVDQKSKKPEEEFEDVLQYNGNSALYVTQGRHTTFDGPLSVDTFLASDICNQPSTSNDIKQIYNYAVEKYIGKNDQLILNLPFVKEKCDIVFQKVTHQKVTHEKVTHEKAQKPPVIISTSPSVSSSPLKHTVSSSSLPSITPEFSVSSPTLFLSPTDSLDDSLKSSNVSERSENSSSTTDTVTIMAFKKQDKKKKKKAGNAGGDVAGDDKVKDDKPEEEEVKLIKKEEPKIAEPKKAEDPKNAEKKGEKIEDMTEAPARKEESKKEGKKEGKKLEEKSNRQEKSTEQEEQENQKLSKSQKKKLAAKKKKENDDEVPPVVSKKAVAEDNGAKDGSLTTGPPPAKKERKTLEYYRNLKKQEEEKKQEESGKKWLEDLRAAEERAKQLEEARADVERMKQAKATLKKSGTTEAEFKKGGDGKDMNLDPSNKTAEFLEMMRALGMVRSDTHVKADKSGAGNAKAGKKSLTQVEAMKAAAEKLRDAAKTLDKSKESLKDSGYDNPFAALGNKSAEEITAFLSQLQESYTKNLTQEERDNLDDYVRETAKNDTMWGSYTENCTPLNLEQTKSRAKTNSEQASSLKKRVEKQIESLSTEKKSSVLIEEIKSPPIKKTLKIEEVDESDSDGEPASFSKSTVERQKSPQYLPSVERQKSAPSQPKQVLNFSMITKTSPAAKKVAETPTNELVDLRHCKAQGIYSILENVAEDRNQGGIKSSIKDSFSFPSDSILAGERIEYEWKSDSLLNVVLQNEEEVDGRSAVDWEILSFNNELKLNFTKSWTKYLCLDFTDLEFQKARKIKTGGLKIVFKKKDNCIC